MSRKLKWIALGLVLALAVIWGLSLFLGATHGLAVRRARIITAKISLQNMQVWLGTNDLDVGYLAKFEIEPWTNSYDVTGQTHHSILRTQAGFAGQGYLVLTEDGSFIFVYKDESREPKLIDEGYSPPPFPTYAY